MKPVLANTISAFDATNDYNISFAYYGNLPYKNRILILNKTTMATVFDETVTSTSLYHTIPANTLTNGLVYTVQIQTFDKNNVASDLSSKSTLFCFDSPTFEFDSITSPYTLTTPTLNPILYYNQTQEEELNEFIVILYDSDNNEIYNSGVLYNISNISSISGLNNESIYYLEATGNTVHGMSLSTGKITITTLFSDMVIPIALTAENLSSTGQIKLTSNIILISVETGKDVEYINNIEADLRDNYIIYKKCFIIDRNFITKLESRDINENKQILEFNDDDGNTIKLFYHVDTDYINSQDRAFFRLYVINTIGQTYIVSTKTATKPDNTTYIKTFIKKLNDYYDVKMEIGGVVY